VYDSAFGIVLMTPDDIGCSKKEYDTDATNLHLRARQNVILEMGILIGSIGRKKVAILRKGEIENPSDVNGLLYVSFKDSVIKEAGNSIIKHMQ
jgi:predicted nucleotide-binding protein